MKKVLALAGLFGLNTSCTKSDTTDDSNVYDYRVEIEIGNRIDTVIADKRNDLYLYKEKSYVVEKETGRKIEMSSAVPVKVTPFTP